MSDADDARFMDRALELARRGEGAVEPNPMVGCVLVRDGQVVGEGYHQRFGSDHAEVVALAAACERAQGATAYVTLEPCSHFGKTPPCADALVRAGVRRVVAAGADPFPAVAGNGFARLRAAGIDVRIGVGNAAASALNAPYLKLLSTGRPWVIAKWAMSLDGKIATESGESRWISGPESRAIVHHLRGRVDGVLVGSRTAQRGDPLLTARPSGVRVATRVVLDSRASLSLDSQLIRTARQTPVLVAASQLAPDERCAALESAGCEVLRLGADSHQQRWLELLDELGRRRWTNVLVEGGGEVFGSLLATQTIDEVHVFVAPIMIGGATAPGPVAGSGIAKLVDALALGDFTSRNCGRDIHLTARTKATREQA